LLDLMVYFWDEPRCFICVSLTERRGPMCDSVARTIGNATLAGRFCPARTNRVGRALVLEQRDPG
jgi:hypothetical protein